MTEYINHSGGCEGADMMWDQIGKLMGFYNHIHYRQPALKEASPEVKKDIEDAVYKAAIALKRPTSEFKGKDLVRRNYFQAKNADSIYALSYIIEDGATDARGFVNNTGKQVVAGGTGWTVEMGIQMGKTIYVFDMNTNKWYVWMSSTGRFEHINVDPILTRNYAGIGTRHITDAAQQAIKNVYTRTANIISYANDKYDEQQAIYQTYNGNGGKQ